MSSTFKNNLIYYTILTLIVLKGPCVNNLQHEYEITRNISESIVEIVNSLFVKNFHYRVFNFQVQLKNRNQKYLYFFDQIIDKTMHLLRDDITIRLGYGIPIPSDQERHYCVLLVDSKDSLQLLYKNVIRYHLYSEGSFFIVLHTFPQPNHYYDELVEIMNLNWLNGITHADVLVYAFNNLIVSFHTMPFTRFHCKGVAPVIHNKFINGHWLHNEFVLAKTENLYGCPLVCATWEDLPYFQLDKRSTEGQTKYGGLEGYLLEYLSAKMNFTVTMRWLNDEEINQTIYDEQGVFNKLFESGTDFVIGAFRFKPTSLEDPFTPTQAYYMSNYYFVVSSKTDAYDPFTKLLLPFDTEIWIILIFIFVFGNAVAYAVSYLDRQLKHLILGRRNNTPTYNMVVISLGGAVYKDPKIPFSRFLLMLWLIASFVLRVVYQGLMFHFIRNDLHKPLPRTIGELVTDEYRIMMSEVVYNDVINLEKLYNKAEIFNTSEIEAFEMLRNTKGYGSQKSAILTAHEYFGYYKLITPINYDLYVVPQTLFTQQLSIYMKKNSVFLKRFNLYIKNYIDEGLMNRWADFLVYSGGSSGKISDDHPRAMKISHLFGAYRLLLMGLSGSFIVLIGEIFIFLMSMYFRSLRKK